jgi:hypothetical protein
MMFRELTLFCDYLSLSINNIFAVVDCVNYKFGLVKLYEKNNFIIKNLILHYQNLRPCKS